jgi:hypothetical protein
MYCTATEMHGMDAAEGSKVEALLRRVADLERERDALREAGARAEADHRCLADRYADLDARWRRSSVGSVILFRAAQQVWSGFARWQDALARHRVEREVDAAWSAFDRVMARLPAALADDVARPDAEPIETIEQLVLALRALVESARPNDAGDDPGEILVVQSRSVQAARQALERYEKLRWLSSRG